MSVSTSDDHVQAVIDILDNASVGDFANYGSLPDGIEAQEDVSQNTKSNRDGVWLYVYSASDENIVQQGKAWDAYESSRRVSVDIWSANDASTDGSQNANLMKLDVRDILLDFVNDNQSQTKFGRFHPVNSTDLRQETHPNSGDHARIVSDFRVQVLEQP